MRPNLNVPNYFRSPGSGKEYMKFEARKLVEANVPSIQSERGVPILLRLALLPLSPDRYVYGLKLENQSECSN